MKAFKKVLCGIALATLAMGAGVAAMSHFGASHVAHAEVVETEPQGVLHLDQTKIKGYTRHNYQTMEGHTGSTITAYVFEADGNTSVNPEIRFVTEGTEGGTKVAYGSAVTTAYFWYKLTNSSPANVADGDFPYLLQVLDSQGDYPLINWQPVADGLWHSWCMEVPTDYQSRFAGFVVKMGDINGQLAISDVEINTAVEANQIGYFELTKFISFSPFGNSNDMFMMTMTGTDFPDTSVAYNVNVSVSIINAVGFTADMQAVNSPFNALIDGQSYLNYWVRPGTLTFMPADGGVLNNILHFPQGLRVPSYNYFANGVKTYYTLKDAMTVKRVNLDRTQNQERIWSLQKDIDESLILGDFTITQVQSFRAYSGNPANLNEQVLVWVSGTDYIDVDGSGSMQQKVADEKFPNIKAEFFYGSAADADVAYLPNIIPGEFYHNFTTRHPLFSFAPEGVLSIDRIIFKAGLLIPSYSYISGGAESYYRLSTDTAYIRLEAKTEAQAWNNWKVDRPAEKLATFTYYNCQWCGVSNESWGGGKTWIIIKFNEEVMFGDFDYNVNYSAYVSEEYYLNKIKVNGKLLSEYDDTELLESFRANAIGQNQFGIVFAAGFGDVESFELMPGVRFPAHNIVDYYEMNQHLLKSVHSPIFDVAELDAFGPTYMHLDIPESEVGTGLCATEGWYAAAKTEFMGWEEYKRAVMYDFPDIYGAVMARLAAWARANGDTLAGWNIQSGTRSINPLNQNVAINVSIIVVCVTISLVAGVAILLTIKKRKHQR